MDNKKFEKLIDLIINENEEQARELFHDIVVEKSREIYESIMADEQVEESDMVGDLMDEISSEEAGGMSEGEDEDEFDDIEVDTDDEMTDLDSEMDGDLEDRVVDLEDKLDQLMAEFEELMGDEEMSGMDQEGGMRGDMEMGDDDEELRMMESSDDEEDEEEVTEAKDDDEEDEEDTLEESVQLQKVAAPKHGDNGVNTKSVALSGGPKVKTGASPANLNKGFQDSGKGGTQGGLANPTSKDMKGASSWKNAPGIKGAKTETAPKPQHGKGSEGQNNKSIVGESKKSVKKIIKK
jgi:hypothetical protein